MGLACAGVWRCCWAINDALGHFSNFQATSWQEKESGGEWRVWGGCREDRGQEEKRDSHYYSGLRRLLFPTSHIHRLGSPRLFSFFLVLFIFLERACSRTSRPFAQNPVCYTLVASGGEGRSGRGINLGLPHSVLGFQPRRYPLKVSGAPAAFWSVF